MTVAAKAATRVRREKRMMETEEMLEGRGDSFREQREEHSFLCGLRGTAAARARAVASKGAHGDR